MTQGQRYGIKFVTLPPTYNFIDLGGAGVASTSGTTGPIPFAVGVSIATSNLPNSFVYFNGLGTPYTDAAIPGNPLSSVIATVSLSSGGSTRNVQIFPETGMVRVQ